MLSNQLIEYLQQIMQRAGETPVIESILPLQSRLFYTAYRIETAKRKYLLKLADSGTGDAIKADFTGLKYLQDSKCVLIPQIYHFQEKNDQFETFLLIEWIERGTSTPVGQRKLGEQLAALHDASAAIFGVNKFGFVENNFIGNNPQINSWEEDWTSFFIKQRLKPQIALGVRKNLIDNNFRDQLNQLCDKIPVMLKGQHFTPCLLHGDLWGGNVLFNLDNLPVLIDPAVYFGVPEAELAFTEMFGGFTKEFYEAYHHVLPIPYRYQEHKRLYNLYHVLNHMNLFGNMYLYEAQFICKYYLGH